MNAGLSINVNKFVVVENSIFNRNIRFMIDQEEYHQYGQKLKIKC